MRVLLSVLLFCLVAWSADGQTIWSRPYEPSQVAIEGMLPDPSDAETGSLSGATFLTGTFSLSKNVELAGELPMARHISPEGDTTSTTALGNPYLGVGLSSTRLPLMMEVGARVPVVASSAPSPLLRTGAAADVGRTRAFTPNEFSLSVLPNARISLGRKSSLHMRSGITYASFSAVDTTGAERTERDWRLLYSAQIWREGEGLILGVGLSGRAVLTAPGSYRTNSQHHLVGSLMGPWNVIQPGLLLGVSLNDLPRETALLFGVTLSISYAR